MPSISQGKLYHFDRHSDVARLTCMKADTGEELWRFEYPTKYEDFFGYNSGPRCCPVIDDDRVYIFGVEGMLHCLNAGDGKLVWKVDTTKDFGVVQNFFGVGSTPVDRGRPADRPGRRQPARQRATSSSGKVTGNGSAVVAFDKKTGKVHYKISDELASYASPVLATIDGQRWLLALRPRRPARLRSGDRQGLPLPLAGQDARKRQRQQPRRRRRPVLITECYGPGSAC